MSRIARVTAVSLLMIMVGFVTGCQKATESGTQSQKYTCPMHPEVVQDQPGKCPKCQMDLVPKS